MGISEVLSPAQHVTTTKFRMNCYFAIRAQQCSYPKDDKKNAMISHLLSIASIGTKINRLRLREDRRISLVRLVRHDHKNPKGLQNNCQNIE